MYINAMASELGIPSRTVSKAKYGQKKSDLLVRVGTVEVAFEVKGVSSFLRPLPFFDKSVRRRSVPDEVEEVAEAYIESLSWRDGGVLKRIMLAEGYPLTFLGMLDFFRDKTPDPTIGLAEDPGSPSSGKLPRALKTSRPEVLHRSRLVVLDHFRKSGDSYFVVHQKADDDVRVFHTGHGRNDLRAPPLPRFREVHLETYGGASKGATRVAFKINF